MNNYILFYSRLIRHQYDLCFYPRTGAGKIQDEPEASWGPLNKEKFEENGDMSKSTGTNLKELLMAKAEI